ncbi:hypothetical protein LOZ80_34685 [Paenibacillus sp. HWE-109]|uniref:hypothetical protein n=1 Tax=Paenibacillus sp. HWE-109 TaxID=1306526 RepID=UPI001EDDC630|nr:hypothetical protein [Paenibacillus sp. HWE-109]UKS26606.1 hypothetical protein LOZ80_34685 [Paenibacillus sp. HWE-109]
MSWQPNSLKYIQINSLIIEEVKRLYSYSHANGGVILACFEVINKDVFSTIPFMNIEYKLYFENLLSCYDIVTSLPELKIGTPFHDDVIFERSTPFILDGEIASTLFNGGAYRRFQGSPRDAKNIAEKLCDTIIDGRYAEVILFKTNSPWCDWFFDVAWDYTWIIFDKQKCRFWLMCLTDTD